MISPVSTFVNWTCLLAAIAIVVVVGERRGCSNAGIMLSNKILGSPIIVYGESMEKSISDSSSTQLLFKVMFRVDCILKGEPTQRIIQITDAGIKMGRSACQYLEAGTEYVVFLEKWKDGYRPTDFQELTVADNMTIDLLQKTCQLTRMPPTGQDSVGVKCPAVSMRSFCPDDERLDIMSKHHKSEQSDGHTESPFNANPHFGNFQLQKNVNVTDGKMKIADKGNNGLSAHYNGNNFIFISIMISFIYFAFVV